MHSMIYYIPLPEPLTQMSWFNEQVSIHFQSKQIFGIVYRPIKILVWSRDAMIGLHNVQVESHFIAKQSRRLTNLIRQDALVGCSDFYFQLSSQVRILSAASSFGMSFFRLLIFSILWLISTLCWRSFSSATLVIKMRRSQDNIVIEAKKLSLSQLNVPILSPLKLKAILFKY